MALIPSTTYMPCPGSLIPQESLIKWHLYKTDIRYSAEAHLYLSAQPSVFSHIVLNFDVSDFCSFNSSIKRLICAVVVAAYCFLSSDKK